MLFYVPVATTVPSAIVSGIVFHRNLAAAPLARAL